MATEWLEVSRTLGCGCLPGFPRNFVSRIGLTRDLPPYWHKSDTKKSQAILLVRPQILRTLVLTSSRLSITERHRLLEHGSNPHGSNQFIESNYRKPMSGLLLTGFTHTRGHVQVSPAAGIESHPTSFHMKTGDTIQNKPSVDVCQSPSPPYRPWSTPGTP